MADQQDNLHSASDEESGAARELTAWQKERAMERRERLGKRLTYLLRYGAAKEGLNVHQGGYIDLRAILTLPIMSRTSEEEMLDLVTNSTGHRGTARYEWKAEHGTTYVRARHRQQMERSPYHEGSKVTRLLESCINTICANIEEYDFLEFPDLFLLNAIIHKLKREKLLNKKTLQVVLVPCLEQLNLQGVYITAATLKQISRCCPNLRMLNLHACYYILNDHYMEHMFKKLTKLESLNLSCCHHLTDRTLNSLSKNCKGLKHFVGSGDPQFSEQAILKLVRSCPNLEHLDIYDNPNISDSGREALIDIGRQRKLIVVLKDLTDKTVAPDDAGMVPCVWTVTYA